MLSKEKINEIRKDFKYLEDDPEYIYFDNAATTQKPIQVLEDTVAYYERQNGNPHRGAHKFAVSATEVYENGRKKVADFINANSANEIIFLRNATEALNLIAYSYALNNLKKGDEILISIMEHHSNLVTWQFVANKTGAKLNYLYLDDDMQITDEEFDSKINKNTKILAITAASNVVGTMPNIKTFIEKAKNVSKDIITVVDAAQYAPHHKVDVKDLNCDFLAFSGHKMLSSMGIGVLYGKEELLNTMDPFLYGGDMIEYVREDESTFLNSPQRFEAGTTNVGGVASLVSAINYIDKIGIEEIYNIESELCKYAYEKIKKLDYIDVYTTSNSHRSPVIAFNVKEAHPHDVASILDNYKIAVRSGHHCAQPLHRYLGVNASCRASFAFYNTFEEIDSFIEHLEDVRRILRIGSK